MGCASQNATEPSPAIAPGAEHIDARAVAERIGAICTEQGHLDPRLPAIVPGFDAPFFQAGLAGYSDAAMRIIARRHGCPLCVTEALLDRTLLGGGRGFDKADLGELCDNVPGGEEDQPLVGQIMGSEPAEIAAAAVKMVEQRARRDADYRAMSMGAGPGMPRASSDAAAFAAIDVNLACPVKKVKNKARGGHWLAEPDGAIRILEAVRDALPPRVPVTVKMRRSYDDTPAMADAFERILNAAFDIGCAWVTVHARSVEQKYVGPSRWDLLRDIVARHPGRIIFGSGDVWSAEDIFRMIEYTGVKAVSVARGCIGNPWIFRQARDLMGGRDPRPPTIGEQRSVLEQHFELALAVNARHRKAEAFTGRTMRKFGIRFAEHHPRAEEVRRRFIAVESLDDWRAVLDEWYPLPAPDLEPDTCVTSSIHG